MRLGKRGAPKMIRQLIPSIGVGDATHCINNRTDDVVQVPPVDRIALIRDHHALQGPCVAIARPITHSGRRRSRWFQDGASPFRKTCDQTLYDMVFKKKKEKKLPPCPRFRRLEPPG